MKTSSIIIGGILTLGVGFLAYKFLSRGSSPYSDPNQAYFGMAGGILTQPSQQYPVQPIIAPRVDNQSEPWYRGTTAVATQDPTLDVNFTKNVAYVKGFAEITESLSDIWSTASGWFSEQDSVDYNWH